MGIGGSTWHPDPVVRLQLGLDQSRYQTYNQPQAQQVSPLNDLLAKALAAKANAPTMNQHRICFDNL